MDTGRHRRHRHASSGARAAATTAPSAATFGEVRWFGDEVLWLAPTPERLFRELSDRSAAVWPEAPRYAGEFEDVVPHLTIGEGNRATLQEAETELAEVLPLHSWASELWWFALDECGRWVRRAAFPFGR
ncbi:2'-5' RNA ligase family protein [Micromonospora sp. CPCC 206061]|uniref:2'-5' RNA ligase family protein n=1 Tax=Micromonospora sp. CPCC 206061 TaxID=3122410 RepID=UPI002FF21A82